METPLFNKAWQGARIRIFSLQALPEYNSEEEIILFEKWKGGDKEFSGHLEWFNLLEKTSQKGIAVQNVRVISFPLAERMMCDIDLSRISRNYGEQTLFLEREKYMKILADLGQKQEDFWIFDDKLAIVFDYNEKGELIGEELITEKNLVEKYINLKKILLGNSLGMTPFLYKRKRN